LESLAHASGFLHVEEIELKSLAVPDSSPATRAMIQEKEAALVKQKLAGLLSSRGVFFLLDDLPALSRTRSPKCKETVPR
jgi:hypothetical protein